VLRLIRSSSSHGGRTASARFARARFETTASALGVGCLVVVSSWLTPAAVHAQVPADARLEGTVHLGDSLMREGTVVLHHLSDGAPGRLDSLAIAGDGTFAFPLPNVPDPTRNDVFFASVRHQGVLYFGPAITTALELDSIYEIHAYDTLLAPVEGVELPLQSRSVFFEPDSAGWRVTDLFQVRNDEPRTIVARDGGRVWSHPLPAEAQEARAGEGELSPDAAEVANGELVVRAALSPGERVFVVRYRVDSPLISIPNASVAENVDVLVREPAPPIVVEGLELIDRVEIEAGSTYLRFGGTDVTAPLLRLVETEASGRLRVEWAAVVLALVLAAAAVLLLRPGRGPSPLDAQTPVDREALLVRVARLDEEFDRPGLTPEEREEYRRRRADLLRRIREASP
jgi:hypothetical protein